MCFTLSSHKYGKENDKTIVLIHPAAVMRDYFDYVIPLLKEEFHLIVPALPGYDKRHPEEMAERLKALISVDLGGGHKEKEINIAMSKEANRREPERVRPGNAHDAAVVIPLICKDGEYEVLFEVRQNGIRQGGEICFPGGRIDANETAEEAAGREIREELLLSADQVRIIRPMHEIIGPGEVLVTSFLAEVKGYEGTFSKNEVARIFTIPLDFFLKHEPERYDAEMKIELPDDFPYDRIPKGKNYAWRRTPHPIWFYETEEGTIWGMTAAVMYLAAGVLKGFIYVDEDNDGNGTLQRSIKDSYYAYRDIISTNGEDLI